MSPTGNVIWTPEAQLEVVSLRPSEMLEVQQWATLATKYGWSFGCPKCHHDFIARNGLNDRIWSFHCACREFKSEVAVGNV